MLYQIRKNGWKEKFVFACRMFFLAAIFVFGGGMTGGMSTGGILKGGIPTGLTVFAASDAPVVRVGYYENEIFEEGASEGAVKTGYAYEYYRKISEYTGWKYEYVYGDYSDLYQMLLDGEIDLLAGLAFKEERVGLIAYPEDPMGNEAYNLVRHGEDEQITADPTTMEGLKFGVLESAMVDVLKGFLKDHHVTAEIVTFSDYVPLFEAFDSHEIDILATEGNGTYGREDTEVLCSFGASDYYLTVNVRREDLVEQLNAAQALLKADEPYYLTTLNTKYYPVTLSSRAFSGAEREWIDTHDTLRLGYLEHYLPYSDTDEHGQVTGIVKDILPVMLERLGLDDVRISFQGYQSYDSMIEEMSAGNLDVIFPVGGGVYYAEESGIYQSNPVISASTDLIYKGEYGEASIASFAVNENNRMQDYYVRTNFPNAERIPYPSIEACLQAVLDGKVGGTTLNGMRANDILKNRQYRELSLQQLSRNDDRCFGVMIGDEGLLKLMNRGISVLGSDYVQDLAYPYADQLHTTTLTDFLLDHILLVIAAVLAVLAAGIGFVVYDKRRTRKQMRERAAAQAALEEKNQELEQSRQELAETDEIIADAGFGVWHIVLEEGKRPRLRGNAKMLQLLGIRDLEMSEEDIYDAWYTRIAESALPSVQKSVAEMLEGKLSENTYQWEHPEKGMIYVRCGGTAKVRDAEKQLLRGYHADVTDIVREELEQKKALSDALMSAEFANRAKTAFLNNMSHDIRTPMNAIVGFTALASTHLDNRELVKDYLGKITVSSQHLLSLINDVLDMSRIESGKMTLEEGEVHLPAIIHDLQIIVQANIDAKHQTLSVDMRDVVNEDIISDQLRLNQVLLNILSNSIKFTPDGGKIELCVSENPSGEAGTSNFIFRIRDNGIGMSKEFQKTIFDAFTREKNSTVSGIQGTGLGMAITKKIVDMMGGTITVSSEEGKGSEFVVTIPCRICERHAREEQKQQLSADFSGKRILLAEDNEMNQLIAQNILEGVGFAVEIAGDGAQAVQMMHEAAAGHFDAILMDIQMPVMDGYEAARKIRAMEDPQKAGLPIIAVTANAFEEDRKMALEAGMNGHLAKPYDIPKMLETLAAMLA